MHQYQSLRFSLVSLFSKCITRIRSIQYFVQQNMEKPNKFISCLTGPTSFQKQNGTRKICLNYAKTTTIAREWAWKCWQNTNCRENSIETLPGIGQWQSDSECGCKQKSLKMTLGKESKRKGNHPLIRVRNYFKLPKKCVKFLLFISKSRGKTPAKIALKSFDSFFNSI